MGADFSYGEQKHTATVLAFRRVNKNAVEFVVKASHVRPVSPFNT